MLKRVFINTRTRCSLILYLIVVIAAPSVRGQSGPTSDDFHSTTLNTSLWTVVNPVGDGTVSLNGLDAVLSLPAGTPHDAWSSGNQTLRILQNTSDVNFQVEVKFDSIPTLGNQDQGIFVQTDANNYVRFDVYSDGSALHMFAATFVNNSPTVQSNITISGGKAPFWIRVNRSGSTWTDSWSVDGTNYTTAATFSYALVVNQIGPYVGNCCNASTPAYTAYIDYFFNTASPISPADGGMWGATTAPTISGINAGTISSTGASVSWTTNEFSSSRVDYGLNTSYGSFVSTSSLVLSHSISLTGLTCNTLYHYKVSSTNSNGITASSGDNTFTTAVCGTTGGPTSDDFHSTTLNTSLWTVVNPLGDGSVSLNGLDAVLSLPAKTPHDAWSSGNQTLRIMQNTTDTDFQAEVKFDSIPTLGNQDQGIFVQTDVNNYLRFDIYFDGSNTHVFAASFINNSPTIQSNVTISGAKAPFWMRIQRSGNSWTQTWSVDGTSFTTAANFNYAMVVNQIGPYAGNCCNASTPAYTAYIDYFFNTASPISPADGGMWTSNNPPVISGIGTSSITATSATVSWTTDQFSNSRVNYGTTTSYGSFITNATSVTGHSLTLSGLTCNTPYHYQVSSTNTNGITASSGDNTFTTGACGASGGPTSDDFHSTTLNTSLWTVVNPLGDGTVTLNGLDAVLSLPAGTPHDAWSGGNQTLRIMQNTTDTDFQVEVKFDSIPTVGNQDQGIFVQTDVNNYLRFDVYSDGTNTHMFAASFINNSPTAQSNVTITGAKAPFWMRVKRSGNTWTQTWSVDGTNYTTAANFTYALVVNQIGPYVGNCCNASSPAYIAYIDYFFNTASPISNPDGGMWGATTAPTISGISASGITSTGATIAWSTNQFASSRVDYGTTTSYGSFVSNSGLVTGHSMALIGLTCNTPYHYQVSSTDTDGFTASSGDNMFTTSACGSTGGPVSDDFHSTSLNTSLWTVVNPLGDGTVTMNGTNLLLSLPAGTPHDVYNSDPALRVMQTVANIDFDVVVKFDSAPTAAYEEQGIIIEQDSNNWLRFDFYRDLSYVNVFALVFANGTHTTTNTQVLDGSGRPIASEYNMAGTLAPFWLRVTRSGSNFTESWSIDGVNYTVAKTITSSLTVNRMGPFLGNCCGTSTPAFTESVDYFFNVNSPISPEDGGAPDIPTITPFPANPPITGSSPVVYVWYGDNQTFGQNGIPQTWVNILGTVYGSNPISSLTYSLNGGTAQPLSIGVNISTGNPRLPEPGDFNVEIAYSSLVVGTNTVAITATDNQGHQTTHNVTVNYINGTPCALPCTINWSTVTNIQNVAQVVDGKWEIQSDGTIRTLQMGYDRLLAIGDMSWTNYEITVPVTVHAVYSSDFGVGIVTGWQGHTNCLNNQGCIANSQPNTGHPFFGLAWYINHYFDPVGDTLEEIYANSPSYFETPLINTPRVLTLGQPYMFKFRVQRNTPSGTHYSLKFWQVGTTEPSTWDLVVDDSDTTLGSILLASYHGDVSYGTVTITAPQ